MVEHLSALDPTSEIVLWSQAVEEVLPVPQHPVDWTGVPIPRAFIGYDYTRSDQARHALEDDIQAVVNAPADSFGRRIKFPEGAALSTLLGIHSNETSIKIWILTGDPEALEEHSIGYGLFDGAMYWENGEEADRVGLDYVVRSAEAMLWATIHPDQFPVLVDKPQASNSQKRTARKSGADLNAVKVVQLRPRVSTGRRSKSGGGRQYTHRWEVEGHWRNQAYGPGRTLRRSVWIAPYVKGPKDKPIHRKMTVKVF